MGASHKGYSRPTSVVNRRNNVIPMMLSTLSHSKTATFSSNSNMNNNQAQLQQIPAHLLIELIASTFPQFAPLAYLAYFGYKVAAELLKDENEFRSLKRIIKDEVNLLEELGAFVIENGIRKINDKFIKNKIKEEIQNEVMNLLVNRIFQQIIKKSVGNNEKKQEKLQAMIATGVSQFIVESISGSTDKMIIKSSKVLSNNEKISDSEYEKILNEILSTNMIISSIKLQLSELITDHIESIAKDIGIKLNKKDKDDIEIVIDDVLSSLSPSVFKIPFNIQPNSENDLKSSIEQIEQDEIKTIILLVIDGLKQRQTNLGEFFGS